MKKHKFVCTNCQHQYGKWQGRCDYCGSWNSVEEAQKTFKTEKKSLLVEHHDIKPVEKLVIPVIDREISRFFNGGFRKGSLYLLYGEPGAGKSTLTALLAKNLTTNFLFVSGEEPLHQVKSRFDRIGVQVTRAEYSQATYIEDFEDLFKESQSAMVFIDSIQTLQSKEVSGYSTKILKDMIISLQSLAIKYEKAIFIVGHVTKAGDLAGPKHLEHMVDCVLSFKDLVGRNQKVLSYSKNRYGSEKMNLFFKMTNDGLKKTFHSNLSTRKYKDEIGRVFTCEFHGEDIFDVLVDGIVEKNRNRKVGGIYQGIDLKQAQLIEIISDRILKTNFSRFSSFVRFKDTFGYKSDRDFAFLTSLYLAANNKKLNKKVYFIGSIDLNGDLFLEKTEIESVNMLSKVREGLIVGPQLKNFVCDNYIALSNIKELPTLTSKITF